MPVCESVRSCSSSIATIAAAVVLDVRRRRHRTARVAPAETDLQADECLLDRRCGVREVRPLGSLLVLRQGVTCMVNGLPEATRVVFDDERVVANAGVVLPAVLAGRLGIEALVDRTVDLGDRAGAANPGRKVMTLIFAMALGADCIDNCDVLRSGQMRAVMECQRLRRSGRFCARSGSAGINRSGEGDESALHRSASDTR
jgi:hypothetical protein